MSKDPRHLLGASAEERAGQFLVDHGYEIIDRNVRYKIGELDIVAREGDTLVFVEVRARSHPAQVHPAATVTPAKQRRLVRAAMAYCQDHRIKNTMIRFDVVAVLADSGQIELYRNAFEAGR